VGRENFTLFYHTYLTQKASKFQFMCGKRRSMFGNKTRKNTVLNFHNTTDVETADIRITEMVE
jgi:hypothetical protein